MNKVRQNDKVIVLAGRDKGGVGVVEKVINDAGGKPVRVVVGGINLATCYVRPNPQKNDPGGVVKRPASLHVSNIAVVDPDSGLPARIKIMVDKAGKKTRAFHVSGGRRT